MKLDQGATPQGEEALDLRQYIGVLLRRWWLIVLVVTVAGAGAFAYGRSQGPVYEATAILLVRQTQNSAIPTMNDINVSQALAQTYSQMLTTSPILERVTREMQIPYSVGQLREMIRVNVGNTQLLKVSVRGSNAGQVADIANHVADAFISDTQEQQLAEIARLQAAAQGQGIADIGTVLVSQLSAVGSLRVVQPAQVPTGPMPPATGRNVLLAGMLGLVLASLGAFALEYFDDRVKSPDEAGSITGLSLLGNIPFLRTEDRASVSPRAAERRRSPPSEPFDFIETNLRFLAVDRPQLQVLLVTSPSPGDGKSTVALHLANTIAGNGRKVVLVDADLRRPSIAGSLQIENAGGSLGLSGLLLGHTSVDHALVPTMVSNLSVLPTGPLPPDPVPLLRSAKLFEVLQQVKERAEVVILDTPPILAVTDPLLLAPASDAVLLVVRDRVSRQDAVLRAGQMLASVRGGAFVAGLVFNAVRPSRHGGYHYQYYYHYYHYYRQSKEPRPRSLWVRAFSMGRRHRHRTSTPNVVPSGPPASSGTGTP